MRQVSVSDGPALSRGARALAANFGRPPVAAGALGGAEALSVCDWRVEVDRYDVPALPEMLVALHTRGLVLRRTGSGWGPDRSVPGRVTVIPPGVGGSFRSDGPLGVTTIHLGRDRLAGLAGSVEAVCDRLSGRLIFGLADPLLSALLAAIGDEIAHPSPQGALYLDRLVDAVVLHILRADGGVPAAAAGGLAPAALRRVRERIESGLDGDLSVDALAAMVGLSRYHFSRAFKRATGSSPYRYILERRIERAQALLRGTDLPLAEIALRTGFAGQSHMSDCFRRHVGRPPGDYRRSPG